MSAEQEEIQGEEQDEYAPRSIFAAGWFRAVLVLTFLAIVAVVALPYLLNWFEPVPSPVKAPAGLPEAGMQTPAPAAAPQAEPASPARAPAPPEPAAPSAVAKTPEKARSASAPAPVPPAAPASTTRAPRPRAGKATESGRAAEGRATAPARPGTAGAAAGKSYWVQLGLFKDAKNAEEFARLLRSEGITVRIAQVARSLGAGDRAGGTYHVVRAGAYRDVEGAAAARRELQARGHFGFVTDESAK